jgi:hypothetical protein
MFGFLIGIQVAVQPVEVRVVEPAAIVVQFTPEDKGGSGSSSGAGTRVFHRGSGR